MSAKKHQQQRGQKKAQPKGPQVSTKGAHTKSTKGVIHEKKYVPRGFDASTLPSASSVLSFTAHAPNLMFMTDPDLNVIINGLSKKSDATKERALLDLQEYLGNHSEDALDGGLFAAWVIIYPRLTIDNALRVRQLSHQTLGVLAKVGKESFKTYVPDMVAFWLAGLYDTDKFVSQAAAESIRQVYTTQDEIRQLWKENQSQILGRWISIIVREKMENLSDVRNSSHDDMNAKYARVMCGGLLSIGHLITSLKSEIECCREVYYDRFIADPVVWQFASSPDVTIRRAIYGFLRSCLLHKKDLIEPSLPVVAKAIVGRASLISQVGSALAYIDALVPLTEAYPESWSLLSSTKQPIPRAKAILVRFVKRGSQSASVVFWERLLTLISTLPAGMLPNNLMEANDLMEALSEGIKNRNELRTSRPAAWNAYFKLTAKLLSIENLDKDEKTEFVDRWISKVLSDYLYNPPQENSVFRIGENASEICAKGLDTISRSKEPSVMQVIESMLSMLTEKSLSIFDGHDMIEDDAQITLKTKSITQVSSNWASMLIVLYRILPRGSWQVISCRDSNARLLKKACDNAVQSEGAATEHAAAVRVLLESYAKTANLDSALEAEMKKYISEYLPDLLGSASKQDMLKALISYGTSWNDTEGFQEGWTRSVALLVECADVPSLTFLLDASNTLAMKDKIPAVQYVEGFITQNLNAALENKKLSEQWSLVKSAFKAPLAIFSPGFAGGLLISLISALNSVGGISSDGQSQHMKLLCDRLYDVPLPVLVSHILSTDNKHGEGLLTRLLALSDSSDEQLAGSAEKCYARINDALKETRSDDKDGEGVKKLINSIRTSVLFSHEGSWLSVDSLVARASELFTTSGEGASDAVKHLLFSPKEWERHLSPLLFGLPAVSLGATQLLNGCVFLVDEFEESRSSECPRDDLNLPIALRMGLFNIRLFRSLDANVVFGTSGLKLHPRQSFEALLKSLLLLSELITDSLQISSESVILKDASTKTESEDVLTEFSEDLAQFLDNLLPRSQSWSEHFNPDCNIDDLETPDPIANVLKLFYLETWKSEITCSAYYSARALARLLCKLRKIQGELPEDGSEWIEKLHMRQSNDPLLSVALLTGYGDNELRASKHAVKLLNALVSDISGIKRDSDLTSAFHKLLVLNKLWSTDSVESATDLPTQRAMFFLKAISDWFQDGVADYISEYPGLVCAAAESFHRLLPQLRTLSGGFWTTVFSFLLQGFEATIENSEENIYIRTSLFKVFEAIRELKAINEENCTINDDVEDEYSAVIEDLNLSWLRIIQNYCDPQGNHEPLAEANLMLERNIYKIPLRSIEEPDELYRHIISGSVSIQGAAFNMLHRYIPSVQEQISIDAALSKAEVFDLQLPLELLSLLEIPTNARGIWYKSPTVEIEGALQSLRGFFLSWLLIFDHFEGSIFKVKAAYIEDLKQGDYINNLLNLTFDFLGHSKGQPVDGSKYSIQPYSLGSQSSSSSGLQDLIALIVHTYFASLRFTPSLVKSWFTECHNRQTTRNVETFTEKYISPMLIDVEFVAVSKWLDDPESRPDGLVVSVSKTIREVRATYEVDDQQMEMVVKLPSSFPLQLVEVKGSRRVAVSESQWRNWLLACQAVIALQSGSIVDGLMLFQRNVKLHLDGVEECAICYSILATVEKTLPNKGCTTCKRKFHGGCLLRWFKSSSSNSCPLCRSAFQFS